MLCPSTALVPQALVRVPPRVHDRDPRVLAPTSELGCALTVHSLDPHTPLWIEHGHHCPQRVFQSSVFNHHSQPSSYTVIWMAIQRARHAQATTTAQTELGDTKQEKIQWGVGWERFAGEKRERGNGAYSRRIRVRRRKELLANTVSHVYRGMRRREETNFGRLALESTIRCGRSRRARTRP